MHKAVWSTVSNYVFNETALTIMIYGSYFCCVFTANFHLSLFFLILIGDNVTDISVLVCFDHIFLKALQAVLKSSIYKPAVWHMWLTAAWTCAWCVKNTDNPLMTVRCRFGLQIVFNPSSFLITTNSHAIFISEVEHRCVYGQIYFQNTLLSGLKVQYIWSFLSNIRLLWHEWIANHQT